MAGLVGRRVEIATFEDLGRWWGVIQDEGHWYWSTYVGHPTEAAAYADCAEFMLSDGGSRMRLQYACGYVRPHSSEAEPGPRPPGLRRA